MKPVTRLTLNLIVEDEHVNMLAFLIANNLGYLEGSIDDIIWRFGPPDLEGQLKKSWTWDKDIAVWQEEITDAN